MALQTKAVIVEAFEESEALYITVEVFVEDKDKLGEKVKTLCRTPLSPLPTTTTEQEIRDLAISLLSSYFPVEVKIKADRNDLIGLEIDAKDGVKSIG